jgi:hypothetical protein
MWIKRIVGVVLITSFVIMGVIFSKGIFFPDAIPASDSQPVVTAGAQGSPPLITLSVEPEQQVVGQYSVLNWSVSGEDAQCLSSGDWEGGKTLMGSASTGRLSEPKQYTFRLSCTGKYGTSEKVVTVNVVPASVTQ